MRSAESALNTSAVTLSAAGQLDAHALVHELGQVKGGLLARHARPLKGGAGLQELNGE